MFTTMQTGSALMGKGKEKMTDRGLLLERLERLAIVLDELMPRCAELVRDAITMLKEQQKLIDDITQRRANNGAFD